MLPPRLPPIHVTHDIAGGDVADVAGGASSAARTQLAATARTSSSGDVGTFGAQPPAHAVQGPMPGLDPLGQHLQRLNPGLDPAELSPFVKDLETKVSALVADRAA